MNATQHFGLLARYNQWSTVRLLDAVDAVPDDDYRRDMGLFFKSIHGTLNHLLVGEHLLWFVRFDVGRSPSLALDAEAEPDRQQLAKRLRKGATRWEPLVAAWPAERWDQDLSYTTTKGEAVSLPFAATLAHVFNHGTHHRGQITAALTALGHDGPVLDLVYFLRAEQAAPNP